MVLEDIIQSVPKPNWLNALGWLHRYSEYQLTKGELDLVCSRLGKSLEAGSAKNATNWLTIGLVFGRAIFVDHVRRTGVLRPSKYDYSGTTIRSAVSRVLASKLDLDEGVARYLTSLKNICVLSDAVYAQLQEIIRQLSRYRGMILRQLLAQVDLLFMLQAARGATRDREVEGDKLSFYSPEDLAEALSFIIFLYRSRIGVPAITQLDETDDQVCHDILIKAAQIRCFQGFEVLVDAFDYSLHFDVSKKKAKLSAPTREFEAAIQLGFIDAYMQKQLSSVIAPSDDALTLQKMGKDFYGLVKDKFVQLEERPFKRYTFRMFTEGPLKDLLSGDHVFGEERQMLEYASRELLAPIDRLLQLNVTGELTIWDVMKTQRMFNFVRWYQTSHLEPKLEEEPDVVLRSLVPSFRKEDILQILRVAVNDKAPAMLDFLSWHPDSPEVLDLQYQPAVEFQGTVLIPINVLSNSSVIRNSLKLSGKRLYSDGTDDPLVDLLEQSLKTRTAKVAHNVRWSWNSADGEIDVIASIDGVLFIFECKKSLLPGNIFELRTSYDYILTAAGQLDAFSRVLSNKEFRETISQKIGWRISDNDKSVTCVVMSNRMFTGYRVGLHAVRSAFEITRQIKSGKVALGREEKCLWQGNEFTGEDLRRFIEDDSLHALIWKSMVPTGETIPIGQFKVSKETVYLDLKLFADNAGFRETSKMFEQQ